MHERASDLKKLFDQKKYSEIIEIIDNEIKEEDINSGLINLSGVCKILRDKSRMSLNEAINDFRKGYLREKNTKNSFEALKNFINVSMDLFDFDFKENIKNFPHKIFDEIFSYLKKHKSLFETDESFALAIIRVFKRTLDIDSVIYYLDKFVESKNQDILCSLIYHNSFKNYWDQRRFFETTKKINEKLIKYNKNELVPLKPSSKEKINIGFVSADIRNNHSITHFLKSILIHNRRNKYNIFLFLNIKQEDKTTEVFKSFADKSINIYNLSDVEAINTIRNHNIDIIFDMMGVTSDQKLLLFKNRLAPIQVSWCGFCNTTGLKEMDYIIADKHTILKNEEHLYSEKIIFMPNIWNCHSGFESPRKKHNLPVEKNNFITFGSFNNFKKINDDVIKAWSQILLKVKNSKLILKASTNSSSYFLLNKFKNYGVDSSVNIIPYKKEFSDHINEYKKIDLALDTFPYNGVTTSFEAIWMGVPILTMNGHNFNSRCGVSINKNLGMNSLIAENIEDYVLKAINLTKNIDELNKLRKHTFEKSISSPLFNIKNFSNDFYNCLENIYNEKND